MKKNLIKDQGEFLRAQVDLVTAYVAERFGGEGDRGEIVSSVWWMIGLVAVAVAAIAVVTAKVTGKLNSLN